MRTDSPTATLLVQTLTEKVTSVNTALTTAFAQQEVEKSFVIVRLKRYKKDGVKNLPISIPDNQASDEAKAFCESMVEIGNHVLQHFNAKQQLHWSTTFLQDNYEKLIIEHFIQAERRNRIDWLSELAGAEIAILQLLHELPEKIEILFIKLNEVNNNEIDPGKKLCLLAAVLEHFSQPQGNLSGLMHKISMQIIKESLWRKYGDAEEKSITAAIALTSEFTQHITKMISAFANYTQVVESQYQQETILLHQLAPVFSITEFTKNVFQQPLWQAQSLIEAKVSTVATTVNAVQSRKSIIDCTYYTTSLIADIHSQLIDPHTQQVMRDNGAPRWLLNAYSSSSSFASTIASNALDNEITPVINFFSYYCSRQSIPLEGILDTISEPYKQAMTKTPFLMLDIYIYFIVNQQTPDTVEQYYAAICYLLNIDTPFDHYQTFAQSIGQQYTPAQLTTQPLLALTTELPQEEKLTSEKQCQKYFLIAYKLHHLSDAFNQPPLTQEEVSQRTGALNEISSSFKNIKRHKKLARHFVSEYTRLFFKLYEDHFKIIIERCLDDNKLGPTYTREVALIYSHLQAQSTRPNLQSLLLFEAKQRQACQEIPDSLQQFLQCYQFLDGNRYCENSAAKPSAICQTPLQIAKQQIIAPCKVLTSATVQYAIEHINRQRQQADFVGIQEDYRHFLETRKNYCTEIYKILCHLNEIVNQAEVPTAFTSAIQKFLSASEQDNIMGFNIEHPSRQEVCQQLIKFANDFGPRHNDENSLLEKILNEILITCSLDALYDAQMAYQAAFTTLKTQWPELDFIWEDPLATIDVACEASADHVINSLQQQGIVNDIFQGLVSGAKDLALTVASATPAAIIVNEIFESEILHQTMVPIDFSQQSHAIKRNIYKQIGISVQEKTKEFFLSQLNQANVQPQFHKPVYQQDQAEDDFLQLLFKFYAIKSLYPSENTDTVTKIILTDMFSREYQEEKSTTALNDLAQAIASFDNTCIHPLPSFSETLSEFAKKMDLDNKYHLLLLKHRLKLYATPSRNDEIQAVLAILNERFSSEEHTFNFNQFYGDFRRYLIDKIKREIYSEKIALSKELTSVNSSFDSEITSIKENTFLNRWKKSPVLTAFETACSLYQIYTIYNFGKAIYIATTLLKSTTFLKALPIALKDIFFGVSLGVPYFALIFLAIAWVARLGLEIYFRQDDFKKSEHRSNLWNVCVNIPVQLLKCILIATAKTLCLDIIAKPISKYILPSIKIQCSLISLLGSLLTPTKKKISKIENTKLKLQPLQQQLVTNNNSTETLPIIQGENKKFTPIKVKTNAINQNVSTLIMLKNEEKSIPTPQESQELQEIKFCRENKSAQPNELLVQGTEQKAMQLTENDILTKLPEDTSTHGLFWRTITTANNGISGAAFKAQAYPIFTTTCGIVAYGALSMFAATGDTSQRKRKKNSDKNSEQKKPTISPGA